MPTGYTHNIENGISFKEFVLKCATAFCRDIEEEEVSTYHSDELTKAKKDFDDFINIPESEYDELAEKEYNEELDYYNKRVKEKNELRSKYEEMLKQVIHWTPPTENHQNLKKFMIEQINTSIDGDCDCQYMSKPKKLTGKEWSMQQRQSLARHIQYHADSMTKEYERISANNLWRKQLRESIGN